MLAALVLWALLAHESVAQQWSLDAGSEDDARLRRLHDLDQEDDVKELFFRRVRSFEEAPQNTEVPANYFLEIPRPGGFRAHEEQRQRVRRDANVTETPESNLAVIGQIQEDVEKRLEANASSSEDVSGSENETGSDINLQTELSAEPEKEGGIIGINDFIRFRRDAEASKVEKEAKKAAAEHLEPININANHEQVGELADLAQFAETDMSKREKQQRAGRMLMHEDNIVPEGSREPRGATKEQWVKQPYPVHPVSVDDNSYDDNMPSPTDVKAPRVHFVTQRRLESAPPPVYRSYEREGRSRDGFREPAREAPPRTASRSPSRKPERDSFYPLERPSKNFDPYPSRPYDPYYDDRYYRYEETRYDPRYGPGDYDKGRPEYSSRQRRIIYYATLPEVVRTPPNVNLRDRYSYRDRFDDRYVAPSPALKEGPYRFHKPYPFAKSRYDEMETKAPYPLKVSTDVSVREAKKNPERRIYSEPDRRYAYKAPAYQSEESYGQRT